MELFEIKRLDKFAEYCQDVIENDEDSEMSEDWLLISVMQLKGIDRELLLGDIIKTLMVYYLWLREAVQGQYYFFASVIRDAIQVEIRHYKMLANELNIPINEDIEEANKQLKKRYLDSE